MREEVVGAGDYGRDGETEGQRWRGMVGGMGGREGCVGGGGRRGGIPASNPRSDHLGSKSERVAHGPKPLISESSVPTWFGVTVWSESSVQRLNLAEIISGPTRRSFSLIKFKVLSIRECG